MAKHLTTRLLVTFPMAVVARIDKYRAKHPETPQSRNACIRWAVSYWLLKVEKESEPK